MCGMSSITFRPDPESERALRELTADGTSTSEIDRALRVVLGLD